MEDPIKKIGLSSRAYNVLQKMGIHTIEELCNVPIGSIKRERNVGKKTISELEAAIRFYRAMDLQKDDEPIPDEDNRPSNIQEDIRNIPIDNIGLSNRACNALHHNEIHTVGAILDIPIEKISALHGVGKKVLKEIELVIHRLQSQYEGILDNKSCSGNPLRHELTQHELDYFSQFSIFELGLSVRAYNCLGREGLITLDKIIPLSIEDFRGISNLGKKTAREIIEKCDNWMAEHPYVSSTCVVSQDENEYKTFEYFTELLHPFFPLSPEKLALICKDELINIRDYDDINDLLPILLGNRTFVKCFSSYVRQIAPDGLIYSKLLLKHITQHCVFNPDFLIDALNNGETEFCKYLDYYALKKSTVIEFLERYERDNRTKEIIKKKMTGNATLQEVAEDFDITRERVRQIVAKFVRYIPDCFEDYYKSPFCYFNISANDFRSMFGLSEYTEFNYLSVKYKHGALELSAENVEAYTGPFKELISTYIQEKESKEEKKKISKTDLVYRVLVESVVPLSIEQFQIEYDRYLLNNGFGDSKYQISIRSVINRLRNSKNVVFNRNNEIRYIEINTKELIDQIDFSLYKNLIISSELVYKNNFDLMDDYDVRDGYELFYILKSSKEHIPKNARVDFRRVPTLIFGNGSEEDQVVHLLKELSPVNSIDFFKAYEERYGVRMASAQANLYNYISPYLLNGVYQIDVKTISKQDEQPFIRALSKKTIWFIDDLRYLFQQTCKHSSLDALNAAAFLRIGYKLYPAGYAISSSYSSILDYFDKEVFSGDIVNIDSIDSRIKSLSIFGSYTEKIKTSMEYMEVNPKVYMSIGKIYELFSIDKTDIINIQILFSKLCDEDFFNGNSIWNKKNSGTLHLSELSQTDQDKVLDYFNKLKENKWFLTSILKNQPGVFSLRTSNAVILSKNNSLLNLADICAWLVEKEGKMSINNLTITFNEYFGSTISRQKLADKIRNRNLWDSLITDTIDDYISNLLKDIDSSDNDDDLFAEEFF